VRIIGPDRQAQYVVPASNKVRVCGKSLSQMLVANYNLEDQAASMVPSRASAGGKIRPGRKGEGTL